MRRRADRQLRHRPTRLGLRDAAARRTVGRRARRRAARAVRGRDARTAAPTGSIPVTAASVPDNVVDGVSLRGRDRSRSQPGADVLVVGGFARSIGLYATACAQALGAARVVYADTDAGRSSTPRRWERRPSRSASGRRKLGSFPITVDASGDHGGLHAALRSTARDGTCTSVAVYFEPATPVPLLEMYTRGCTLHTGRCHARALIPEVLALIAAGRLDPAAVTSAVVSFDDAEAGARRASDEARPGAMTEFPLTGGCNCGAVRYEVTEPLVIASYCHCKRCQRRSGTAVSPSAHPAPGTFRIDPGRGRAADVASPRTAARSGSAALRLARSTGSNSQPPRLDRHPDGHVRRPIRGSARACAVRRLRRAVGADPRRRAARGTPRVATVEPEAIRHVVLVP